MRDELAAAGRLMRTDLDTEVLLEACALWGIEKAVGTNHRNVCVCVMGLPFAHASPCTRSAGREAALLRGDARARIVCFTIEGISRAAYVEAYY